MTNPSTVWNNVEKPQRRHRGEISGVFFSGETSETLKRSPFLMWSYLIGAAVLVHHLSLHPPDPQRPQEKRQTLETRSPTQTTKQPSVSLSLSRGVSPPSRLWSLHTMRERSDRSACHRQERRVGHRDCWRSSGRGCSLLTNQMAAQKDGGWGRSQRQEREGGRSDLSEWGGGWNRPTDWEREG